MLLERDTNDSAIEGAICRKHVMSIQSFSLDYVQVR